MRLALALFVSLCGAAHGMAQGYGVYGPYPMPVGTAVKGLHWDSANNRQAASWTFTPSSTYFQPGTTTIYGTIYQISDPYQLQGGGWVPNTTTYTFTSTYPERYTVQATVYANTGEYRFYGDFAAIGGPLSPTIIAGEQYTPATDQQAGAGGSAKYLQYFGYNPAGPTPDGAQTPQLGKLYAPGSQPLGTTLTWNLIGNAVIIGPTTGDQITLGATNQSGYAAIGAHVTFAYNDGIISGSAQDDSDETPPPGTSSPDSTYYRFTSHRPNDLLNYGNKITVQTATGPDEYGIVQGYRMQAKDHFGLNAGGVWVQERFPYETVRPVPGTNEESEEYWRTDPQGLILQGSSGSAAYDALGISLEDPYPIATNTQAAAVRIQKYYGGTQSWTIGDSGVYLRTYNCNFWSDATEHNPVSD